MSRFLDQSFIERFIGAVAADGALAEQARWFDGSIALHDEEWQVWLKLYGGQIVEVRPFAPPTGVTIKVSGPNWAWDAIASGERRIMDLLLAGRRAPSISLDELQGDVLPHPGAIQLEGDGMEALRMMETIYLLLEGYGRAERHEGEAG